LPRVCVIGAGPSGLTTLKNLRQAGLTDIVCYEASDRIGGNWAYSEEEGHSSVYACTFLISSKRLSQFEDYPMPDCYPDFCSHAQVLAYFQNYARDFGILPFIVFGTRVCHAERRREGGWRVRTMGPAGEGEATFDVLLVCSGHHSDPVIPSYPGEFSGTMLHSHTYKRADPFRGQRVLVVGAGNSACDLAVDVSRVASRTALSMRHGQHIIPKLVFGMPVDIAYRRLRHVPKAIRRFLLEQGLRLLIGKWERYGLEPPSHRLMEMHPTLSTDVLTQIRHGRIMPRRGIEQFDGWAVVFTDGRREEFDTVIWATGYRTVFPFFDRSFIDWSQARRLPLYLKMMMADVSDLYFIGLFQPIGCIWTLADYQARIAAAQIAGRLTRPDDIAARIEREMAHPHWRFQDHTRHQGEVDYHDFRRSLIAELRRARPA
jgi:glycine/D-amino acid oxidase-like deaminating enzyme